ncbi:MAG: glycine cleavage system protein GcvH [Ignavibacteriae bacterium]|nr:glycine cleavage system protein GcvH [Ignavibacteria bacterium]MBI3363717.1 glycine cleavage system protein GcvH [Ignavibacteriota bacterium]
MTFPDNLTYTKDHEWVKMDRDIGTVGITDYAQGELGDIVFVELPQPGKQITQGESFGTIEAVKAVSDLYAPVTGEVLEVNPNLEKTPEIINSDPYGDGWMIKMRVKNAGDLKNLLDAKKYRELIGK